MTSPNKERVIKSAENLLKITKNDPGSVIRENGVQSLCKALKSTYFQVIRRVLDTLSILSANCKFIFYFN